MNTENKAPVVLCIYGSPRMGGNSDAMMDSFAVGVEEGGGVPMRIYLRELHYNPCREIYACRKGGECALKDDVTPLYADLRSAEAVALATPVMFYGVSAIAKSFIDRCQALWSLKYLLGKEVATGRIKKRKGVILSVAGSGGQKVFDGVRLTFRYFLDTLDAEPWCEIFCRNADVAGDIDKYPQVLGDARERGRALAAELISELSKENP